MSLGRTDDRSVSTSLNVFPTSYLPFSVLSAHLTCIANRDHDNEPFKSTVRTQINSKPSTRTLALCDIHIHTRWPTCAITIALCKASTPTTTAATTASVQRLPCPGSPIAKPPAVHSRASSVHRLNPDALSARHSALPRQTPRAELPSLKSHFPLPTSQPSPDLCGTYSSPACKCSIFQVHVHVLASPSPPHCSRLPPTGSRLSPLAS